MKVEVVVLGSPSLISLLVSVDVTHHEKRTLSLLRSCVKVEVVVLGSPSLMGRTVFVDVKQQCTHKLNKNSYLSWLNISRSH